MYLGKLFIALAIAACIIYTVDDGWPATKGGAKPDPDQAIQMLKDGNERFRTGAALHPHQDAAQLKLAFTENQGDHAYATVLSCSDSRVPVEILFDAGVMDIFVIRVAGNVIDTDEAGSIEYGLAHVYTPVLVVLGHTQCGAVTAVTHKLNGADLALERNIPDLVGKIVPAVKKASADHPDIHGDDLIPYAIEENVWHAIKTLYMVSPITREMVEAGKVKVVGAIYDLETGKVLWLPEEKSRQLLDEVNKNPDRAKNAMAE